MTNEEFQKLFDDVVQQERETLVTESNDYVGGGDRLWSFRAGAGLTGLSPESTLWGYLAKHLVSIRDLCNGNIETRDHIREKIGEARNHLLLLEALLIDRLRGRTEPHRGSN